MSLITPFGPLSDIPIDDTDRLREILIRSDKSRMLEGIVIEGVFRQYLEKIASAGLTSVPISLVRTLTIKISPDNRKQYVNTWWIWDQSESKDWGARLLSVLGTPKANDYAVSCYYDPEKRDFFMEQWGSKRDLPIQKTMLALRKKELVFEMPSKAVIHQKRSQQAFWAGISNFYSDADLFKSVVLERLFKNCAIQPFFQGVWDIDNIAELPDGSFIQLEVKHKFPREDGRSGALSFGINTGQLRVMRDLAWRGIKTLHMIMVKPRWDKSLGTGYLLNRIAERANVLILGKLMDLEVISSIQQRHSHATGAEQSLTGRGQPNVRYVFPHEFHVLGTLDDPVDKLARNIGLAATGMLERPANDDLLRQNRIIDC